MQSENIIHKKKNRGFTLLEVLVALTIFSVASAALILSDGQSVRQMVHVQDKTIASWLAEERLNRLYIGRSWPKTGVFGDSERFDNRLWYVQAEVTEWEHPSIYQVNVQVYSGGNAKGQSLYKLIGFIRKGQNDINNWQGGK